jgi:hypothetical protein
LNEKTIMNTTNFLIVKTKTLLLVLLLFSVPLKAQKYEYVGIKFGYSPNVSGWNGNPFNINLYYNHLHDPPKIDNFFFGFNFELSRSKYFSTLFEADYKFRNYKFDMDIFNEFGQFTGTSSTSGDISYLSFAVSEKLRYSPGKFSFYVYAGLRTDIFLIKSGYMSLLKQTADMNSLMFGLSSGAGIAFGKKHRFSLEFYYLPDFTKQYNSPTGNIRYSDYGVTLGYGIVIGSK